MATRWILIFLITELRTLLMRPSWFLREREERYLLIKVKQTFFTEVGQKYNASTAKQIWMSRFIRVILLVEVPGELPLYFYSCFLSALFLKYGFGFTKKLLLLLMLAQYWCWPNIDLDCIIVFCWGFGGRIATVPGFALWYIHMQFVESVSFLLISKPTNVALTSRVMRSSILISPGYTRRDGALETSSVRICFLMPQSRVCNWDILITAQSDAMSLNWLIVPFPITPVTRCLLCCYTCKPTVPFRQSNLLARKQRN